MPQIPTHIEHVARLTLVKDRDAVDRTLATVLHDLLDPVCVSLLEIMGPPDQQRCLLRVTQARGDAAPSAFSTWEAWEQAEPLVAWPQREQVISGGEIRIDWRDHGGVLRIPVRMDCGEFRLIELVFDRSVEHREQALAQGVVGVYRNFLNLLDYSERDTLTNLLNRKSFDEAFYKATLHSQTPRDEQPIPHSGQRQALVQPTYWLGVIDVDHFKRVNDNFGHLIGDEVLLLVAGLMRSTFRYDDRLYRFGGEEFVVLLRADDAEVAQSVFERFRHNVEQYPFPQVGGITVSIGYTQIRDHDTPSSAFERADKVVYLAKSSGRNRVCCYEHHPEFAAGDEGGTHQNSVELF